jgi:ElaB/YqjD/DUF883 family membrane-anchored ribosome-binding protein
MDQTKMQGSSKAGGSADSVRDSVASSINRAKEAVSAAASDATDAGSDAVKALQSDLGDLRETVAKLMARAGQETAKSAREITGQVSAAASDIAERGANVASITADHAKTFTTELETIARRNPLGALAGAMVIGVLIGMMGRRS